jgi:hypothetical protein
MHSYRCQSSRKPFECIKWWTLCKYLINQNLFIYFLLTIRETDRQQEGEAQELPTPKDQNPTKSTTCIANEINQNHLLTMQQHIQHPPQEHHGTPKTIQLCTVILCYRCYASVQHPN